jgi:hypothetical protein
MTEKKGKPGGGSKLFRTEVVTVRLDPKLRYLAELAARKQRRTLSSFIEWAIEQALEMSVNVGPGCRIDDSLWDVYEVDRFMKLVASCPELLTYEEQVLWKAIYENDYFWEGSIKDRRLPENWCLHDVLVNTVRLRESWDQLKAGVALIERDDDR